MKILILGLPGAGKTTLALELAALLRCVHFNADDIRQNINKDLGFSPEDRVEQAKRMGHLCKVAAQWGDPVIADLVCPTPECRLAFAADFTVWVDRIEASRFDDTNKMFVPPVTYDVRMTSKSDPYFPKNLAATIRHEMCRRKVDNALLARRTLPMSLIATL